MNFLAILTLLLTIFSCSSKPVALSVREYGVKDVAKLTVQFLKNKSTRMDIGLMGISTKEDAVVLKKEEMSCGKGTEAGKIAKFGKVENDPFIVLPKVVFKEFYLVCENPSFAKNTGNTYIEIKNVYAFTDGAPGKVLASDIKIELK